MRHVASFGLLTPAPSARRAAMSSDVLKRIEAFAAKADMLADKGHLLRANEYLDRAAEAARSLGADNLVAVYIQVRRGSVLACHAAAAPGGDTAFSSLLTAYRAEYVALLSGALAVLERRYEAGTLLEGKCTSAEEAWRASALRLANPNMPAAEVASRAALVGFEEILRAAISKWVIFVCAPMFTAVCSYAQLQSFAQHVVRAAELMQQPRRNNRMATDIEATFTECLRQGVVVAGANGLDERLMHPLTSAWQRLQRSGVIEVRGIENIIRLGRQVHSEIASVVRKSLNALGLRTCALPGCGAKEVHPAHFKSCAACRAVVYCCREHQVAGWPAHKKACKAARKAAAEEEADGGAGPSGA